MQVFDETYLPFKQPNRDSTYPKMLGLRADSDGSYFEMQEIDQYGWGQRFSLRVTSSYNAYWNHTSRTEEYLSGVPELNHPFRLYSISAPYFGADKRSFIDGKTLVCAAPDACARLEALLANEERFDMLMRFGKTVDAPLVLDAIEAPTCQSTMDCRARKECCDLGEANLCVEFEECPAEKRVPL